MTRLRTLRGRLIAAMLLILILAVGTSSLLDRLDNGKPVPADVEPYQDALVLAGFCVPALFLIWLVSSWSLRPLARVSQEARNVGPMNPALRLSAAGLPSEIVPLVEAVNGALDRMAAAFAAERRFTENAAHELRTPLAVLGLRLQRARQSGGGPDWTAIDADLGQINRLVSQMLDLARKENAGRLDEAMARPVLNLSRIAREACAAILPMVESRGRSVSVSLPDTISVRGDADDLRDALRNVLENAVLHGSGLVALDGRMDPGRRCVVMRISDEGAGFEPATAAAAFERFHKGSRSHGMGLGLAIVREVMRSHGGDVAAIPGPPGLIELTLPVVV
jgi:two-component system sensor histidine kinase QseC